ncbi:uncharacterized protein LOC112590671 [Harpegnathos saltator]|uniref:uncharacterized protein LOC112590671 n=1 Tax=Harpegnathos saltator TaxID=610380 RepID=UPI000DBED8DA|nr:uncharacterized protein LOC112590671 [Harpegnathos saltator]
MTTSHVLPDIVLCAQQSLMELNIWTKVLLDGPPVSSVMPPRHADYALFERRVSTFDDILVHHARMTTEHTRLMARAGLFYNGHGDRTCVTLCYHCGVSLSNWSRSDEPAFTHTFWSSHCAVVYDMALERAATGDRGEIERFDREQQRPTAVEESNSRPEIIRPSLSTTSDNITINNDLLPVLKRKRRLNVQLPSNGVVSAFNSVTIYTDERKRSRVAISQDRNGWTIKLSDREEDNEQSDANEHVKCEEDGEDV